MKRKKFSNLCSRVSMNGRGQNLNKEEMEKTENWKKLE
jgi:hypothetical protein